MTDTMRALLAADLSAARSVINATIARCPPSRVSAAFGVAQLSSVVDVRGKQPYRVKRRERRYDLLFVTPDRRAVALEVKLGSDLTDRQLDDLLDVDPRALNLDVGARIGVVVTRRGSLSCCG